MPLPQIPFPHLVDSTMLSALDACEVKWLFEFGHHLSPLAINPDLHAGGAFSHAIESTRRAYYGDNLRADQALAIGIKALISFWGDFTPPEKNPKTCEAMIGALADYFREYPLEEDLYRPHILADGAPAVEFTFSIPTDIRHPETGDPILYGGRSDMIANYDDQWLCILDEKTTKAFYGDWASIWGMRGQFLGYCFAGQTYGYATTRAVIRGIAILKTKYHHLQVIEEYSQWQIDRWWETTNKKIAKMVQVWEDNSWTHSYGDACGSYGGCTFLPLCTSHQPEDGFSNFQRRVWDPLKKDPTWPEGGPKYETLGTIEELIKP